MSREQEYVLRTVEERGVRLIRLWFTDVLGQLKSVAISPAELEQVAPRVQPPHRDGHVQRGVVVGAGRLVHKATWQVEQLASSQRQLADRLAHLPCLGGGGARAVRWVSRGRGSEKEPASTLTRRRGSMRRRRSERGKAAPRWGSAVPTR